MRVFCPGCFSEKSNQPLCPFCGFDEGKEKVYFALPYRTMLAEQYMLGRILGNPGGFGITYLGWDQVADLCGNKRISAAANGGKRKCVAEYPAFTGKRRILQARA